MLFTVLNFAAPALTAATLQCCSKTSDCNWDVAHDIVFNDPNLGAARHKLITEHCRKNPAAHWEAIRSVTDFARPSYGPNGWAKDPQRADWNERIANWCFGNSDPKAQFSNQCISGTSVGKEGSTLATMPAYNWGKVWAWDKCVASAMASLSLDPAKPKGPSASYLQFMKMNFCSTNYCKADC